MQKVAFKAGETIIREGDEGDTAFFIVSGTVNVSVGRGDRAQTVGKLETGEVFGEMSLIDPGPRSATVTAVCDTECLAASYRDFVAAIEDNPERAVGFMKTLVRRLRKARASQYPARDILRAAAKSVLGIASVKKEREKVERGSKVPPLLLVRDSRNAQVIVADGYHRLCTIYAIDDETLVPCKIV